MRTQPPGFRWLVGGFALLAGIAFGVRYLSADDRPSLVFAVICLAIAGYWLIFDSEDVPTDSEELPTEDHDPAPDWRPQD